MHSLQRLLKRVLYNLIIILCCWLYFSSALNWVKYKQSKLFWMTWNTQYYRFTVSSGQEFEDLKIRNVSMLRTLLYCSLKKPGPCSVQCIKAVQHNFKLCNKKISAAWWPYTNSSGRELWLTLIGTTRVTLQPHNLYLKSRLFHCACRDKTIFVNSSED